MRDKEALRSAIVCRIATREEWRIGRETGVLPLRDVDVRDGYMHLSGIDQALATADRHFQHDFSLLALCAHSDRLGPALRWEISRAGEAFPHLYGSFDVALVREVCGLHRGPDGKFAFDAELSE